MCCIVVFLQGDTFQCRIVPTCASEGVTVVRMSVGRSALDAGGRGGASLGFSSWSESESESRSLFISARSSISLWAHREGINMVQHLSVGGQDRTGQLRTILPLHPIG